jgi:hypothetical protein
MVNLVDYIRIFASNRDRRAALPLPGTVPDILVVAPSREGPRRSRCDARLFTTACPEIAHHQELGLIAA